MLSTRNSLLLLMAISLLALTAGMRVSPLRAQQRPASKSSVSKTSAGQSVFISLCVGCHGLDGRGGEQGPNIVGTAKVQRLSNSQLANIIAEGVPGTGMPAFHSLEKEQVNSVVAYIRALGGSQEARVLPGDASRGKQIFFRKGECSTCHSIAGAGGFLGPDLSAYGSTKSTKNILDDIVKPTRIVPTGYKVAVATTRDGTRLEGIVRNEDNFSVQMQTSDGSFHFLEKSELQKLELQSQPLMPTDYSQRLSHDELNDLVSFLMAAASPHEGENPSRKLGDDSE